MWKDAVLFGIPGYIALIISLFVLYQDIRRYYLPLKVRISSYFVLWNEGNASIVLFGLLFVNPASRGKTVNFVRLLLPPEITDKEHLFLYGKDMQRAYCQRPSGGEVLYELPTDQLLGASLDIPPNQSRHVWYPRYMETPPNLEAQNSEAIPFSCILFASDIDGKEMGRHEIKMFLHHLKHPDIYRPWLFSKVKM